MILQNKISRPYGDFVDKEWKITYKYETWLRVKPCVLNIAAYLQPTFAVFTHLDQFFWRETVAEHSVDSAIPRLWWWWWWWWYNNSVSEIKTMGSKTHKPFSFCTGIILFAITLRLVLGPTHFRTQRMCQGYRNVRITTHVFQLLKLRKNAALPPTPL